MPPEVPTYLYIIFTAATALGVLMQAGILLGLFLGFRKLQVKLEQILSHVTEHALPLIETSRHSLEDIAPRLKIISANLVDVSETLKKESHTIKDSVDDVLLKTRAQTARVDEMVSGTLDGLSHASAAIQHGIAVPIRQINGIMSGLRAGLGVLRSRPAEPSSAASEIDPLAAAKQEPSVVTPVVVVVEEEIRRVI